MAGALEIFHTTRDDFKLFKATFLHWVGCFGLKDWEITFRWEDAGEPGSSCGAIVRNSPGRNCTVYFGKTWNMPVTRQDILRTAIHEFSHLLVADIEHLANQRNATEAEVDMAREILARRFENYFYPQKH